VLPAAERLRRASAFQRVYSGKRSIFGQFFTLYVLERQGKNRNVGAGGKFPLVGFVVSKKVIRNANRRNRAKRRVREAYRCLRKLAGGQSETSLELADVINSLPHWYAIVWVINENVLNAPWTEICKKMEECLLRANKKYMLKRIAPQ
jgi:ribonuclease P protein component